MKGMARQQRGGGHRVRAQVRQERRKQEAQKRFTEPLTPKRAGHIARAEAGTEYDPVVRSIRGQARGSVKREKDLGDWYDQEASTQAAAIPVAQAGTASAVAATNARLAAAGQADKADLATIASQNASLASRLGGPVDLAGQQQAAAGDASRAQQAIALNAPLAATGADYVNSLAAKEVATRQRGVEARSAEGTRRRKIQEDLQAAQKQRGQATTKNLQSLREAAEQAQVDRLAFGLKKSTAAISAQQGAARIKVSRSNAKISARNAATSERNAATTEGNSAETRRHDRQEEKGKGALTPTQRRSAQRLQKNANVTARSLYSAAKAKPSDPQSWSAFIILVGKEVGDQVAARKAVAKLKAKVSKEFRPTVSGHP